MAIKKVGVVGCGTMGAGIVQLSVQKGYDVVVSEINDELLKKGIAYVDSRLAREVEKERMSQADKDAAMGRIKGTTDMKDFGDCDLMIEAVLENLELKQQVFAELDKICPAGTVLATNTSCLSIIDIANATKRLDKVLGLHFFNPVPIMKLLEIVRTVATSDESVAVGKEFGETIGKTIIVAKDTPGFIVNRLMTPQLLEAIRMVEAGIATPEDIDKGMTAGLNHPMGAITLLDYTGLDVALEVADYMWGELNDPKFAAPVLLRRMVAAGWLGQKSGKGFYDYSKK